MKISVGIDLGGTNTKIGLITGEGEIIAHKKFSTEVKLGPEKMIQAIIDSLEELFTKEKVSREDISSIGIGVPGTANMEKGIVIFAPNIFWRNVDVRTPLQNHFKKDIYVTQDTRAAAWGEHLFGLGKDLDTIVCVTLGTGIGAGIVINGRIFHGGLNTAGEFGHQLVKLNGNLCNCGRRGCLEAHAGGLAIVKRAKELFPDASTDITVETVFNMAQQGNEKAISIVDDVVLYTGMGMVNMINLLSPQKIILSGGISDAPDNLLLDPLNKFVEERAYPSVADKLKLQVSYLGSNAPLIGASMLWKHP